MGKDKIELLQVLAQIAGVFIAFTALVGLSEHASDAVWNGTVAFIGVLVLIGSVTPLLLNQYKLSERQVWVWSSCVLLVLVWMGIIGGIDNITAWFADDFLSAFFFWGILEVAIQLPLILILIGKMRPYDAPFYFTALIVNIVEAAWLLAFVVI